MAEPYGAGREATPLAQAQQQMADTEIEGATIKRSGRTVTVDFAPGMGKLNLEKDVSDFHKNLADQITDAEKTKLLEDVVEQVEADLDSRKQWQSRVDQAMDLLGLHNFPGDDQEFEGASAVTYPLISEACVQFQARAIDEVFPASGPARSRIVGDVTPEREEQAQRVEEHMNWQMMVQDKAHFWHVDQLLFYLPLTGSAFKKTYYDPLNDMTVSRLVQAGDFIVPYMATDLSSVSRYTHRMRRSKQEMRRLMNSGLYLQYDPVEPGGEIGDTYTDGDNTEQQMLDDSDDRTESSHQDDWVYEILEMHCDLELELDQKKLKDDDKTHGRPLPYIVTVDRTSQELIGIRRNWKENDELYRKRVWFTHYKYMSGLGFYGFGLLHLMGSIAEACTGTIRALLDAAAFANLQGGFVSDEAKIENGEMGIEPGVWKRVKMTSEEMAKAFYTPPYKEPSTALAQLFQILVDTGRRFASITEEMVGDAPTTGPVGTTLALIEQSTKVFSGIHRRLHVAQAEEFQLRAEINFEFMPDEYPFEVEGEAKVVARADYDGRVDVIPVSDPNIVSNTQRIALYQTVLETGERFPGTVDIPKAVERFFEAIRVPAHEELLAGGGETTARLDPISENMKILTSGGAKAFVEQDHDAHIQVHMNFIQGLNEEALAMVMPVMQAHLAEHYAFKYYNEMNAQMGGQLPPPDFMDGGQAEDMDPQADAMISAIAAMAPPIQLMPPTEEGPDEEQAAFEAEEQRKQQAWEAEETRKQEAHQNEQQRKDESAAADDERKTVAGLADESRKDDQEAAKTRREAQSDRASRLRADRGSDEG